MQRFALNWMGAGLGLAFGWQSVLCAQSTDAGVPPVPEAPVVPQDLFASLIQPPGYRLGALPLRVIPELDLSYVHDSNPGTFHNQSNAVNSIRVRPQLGLLYKGTDWQLDGKGWASRDWVLGSVDPVYRDAMDAVTYGESVNLSAGSPNGTLFNLNESFEYLQNATVSTDPNNTVSWQDRSILSMGAGVEKPLGEKTALRVGATYADQQYADTNRFGSQDAGVRLGFSRKLSEKSDALLDFGYNNQWSEGEEGEARTYRVLVGVGSRRSVKTSYRAQVGMMSSSRDNGSASESSWTYDLMGSWRMARRWIVGLSGSADFRPSDSEQDSYRLVQTVGAGVTFEATSRLSTGLHTVYRRETSSGENDAGSADRTDQLLGVQARADYRLLQHTKVYVSADKMQDNSSVAEAGYQRLVLQTGVNIVF